MGGKRNPYELWQAGISLAAPPPLARSGIPPATQAIGWALRSALRVANIEIKKIILKESLWDQGNQPLAPSLF